MKATTISAAGKHFLLLFPAFILLAGRAPGQSGEITVQADRPEGLVSPYLYGVGVEWTENGNGIWDPARNEIRPDVVALLKPLRIPVVRFPGGIMADHYDWRDGIGPAALRPMRANPMDGTVWANNFGTDEFIQFCRQIGSAGLVTANAGTGDLSLASQWQEHFLRRGFPVRFWEVGNEIYLAEPRLGSSVPGNDARIYRTPAQYSAMMTEWSRALRAKDPLVRVGAATGTTNTSAENAGWLDVLAQNNLADTDFVSLHNSFAPLIPGEWDYTQPANREAAHKAMLSCSLNTANDLRLVRGKFAASKGRGSIAVTEHFPLFGMGGSVPALLAQLDQSRTLGAALYTATLFHAYMREGVWMANYNLAMSKWFGALLQETPGGIIKSPVYYVYDLYRNHFGTELLAVSSSSPAYFTPRLGVCLEASAPVLDTIAARDGEGRVYLAVINRDIAQNVVAGVTVLGASLAATAEVRTLTAPAIHTINGNPLSPTTIGGIPDAVQPVVSKWIRPPAGSYSFPARSITIFQWSPL